MDLDLAPAAEPSPRPDAILSSSSHAKRSSSLSVDKDARNKRLKLDGSSAVTAGMNLRTSTPPSPIPESASCSSSSSRQHHDNMVIDVANSSCHHRHDDIFTSVIHPSPSLTSVNLSGSMSDLDNPTDTAMTAAPSPPSSEFSPTNTRASSHDITVVTLPPPILSVSKERSMTLSNSLVSPQMTSPPSTLFINAPLAPVRCSKPLRPVSGVLQHQYHATKPPLLGSRLMALTHAQMTALMLGVVERFGVPEEGIVGICLDWTLQLLRRT
ncbi:hypothetical protein BC829DRAFT_189707 [Chytridium lagenaria]|nr:hypothetical protein BC829DRAFT_189707 [Chytridium lagenaria]